MEMIKLKKEQPLTSFDFDVMSTSIVFFLVAIATTWVTQGSITYTNGGILSDNLGYPFFYGFLYALFIFGVSKAAVMPFHKWLPAAMVAPTPVSALLLLADRKSRSFPGNKNIDLYLWDP